MVTLKNNSFIQFIKKQFHLSQLQHDTGNEKLTSYWKKDYYE